MKTTVFNDKLSTPHLPLLEVDERDLSFLVIIQAFGSDLLFVCGGRSCI